MQSKQAREKNTTIKNSFLCSAPPHRKWEREESASLLLLAPGRNLSESETGDSLALGERRKQKGCMHPRRMQHSFSHGGLRQLHLQQTSKTSSLRSSACFSRKLWWINQMSGARARLCDEWERNLQLPVSTVIINVRAWHFPKWFPSSSQRLSHPKDFWFGGASFACVLLEYCMQRGFKFARWECVRAISCFVVSQRRQNAEESWSNPIYTFKDCSWQALIQINKLMEFADEEKEMN